MNYNKADFIASYGIQPAARERPPELSFGRSKRNPAHQ